MASAGLSRETLAAHNRLARRATADPIVITRGVAVGTGSHTDRRRDHSPHRDLGAGTRRQTTHLGLSREPDSDRGSHHSSHVEKTSAISSRHSIGSNPNFRKKITRWRHGKTCIVNVNGKNMRSRGVTYENSFKMEPDTKTAFNGSSTRREVEIVLKQCFDLVEAYDPAECAILSRTTSEEIKARVKQLGLARYKIVAHVVIGQNMRQGLHVVSRGAWDTQTDDVISVVYEKNDFVVVATVFATYFE